MTTLIQLALAMERYNQAVAPKSRCVAWLQFMEECRGDLHRLPWSAEAEFFVPEGFAEYWGRVAAGESRDFDPASGDYVADA